MTEEIENANMLWNVVIYNLLDLNILWGMEFDIKHGVTHLPEEKKLFYDHFKYIANYYLSETDKYYNFYKRKTQLEEHQKEVEKIVGIPYEEYEKLDIDEQHKLIKK